MVTRHQDHDTWNQDHDASEAPSVMPDANPGSRVISVRPAETCKQVSTQTKIMTLMTLMTLVLSIKRIQRSEVSDQRSMTRAKALVMKFRHKRHEPSWPRARQGRP